jgi:endonuclease/exonuclease/phosphatase family metal-dependent hydrolase
MRLRPLLLAPLALALACCGLPTVSPAPPTPWDAGPVPDAGVDAGRDAGGAGLDAGEIAPPPPEGAVRVASFNVHRFFDTVCDSAECGAGAYEALPSPEQFSRRADQIAMAIESLAVDAVLLQEIESQAAFDALSARLPRLSAAVFAETGLPGSVDVGLLARGGLVEVRRHRATHPLVLPDGTTSRFARELLEVHLLVDGAPVVLFAAHLRSKNNDDPARRLAEAQAAAQIVAATSAERPGALVVLGGDLNDEPGSPPLAALEAAGELLRVASELPAGGDSTYWYDGRGQAIDHLLLDTRAAGGYVAGSVRVAHGPAGFTFGGSDHAALVADFALPAAQ